MTLHTKLILFLLTALFGVFLPLASQAALLYLEAPSSDILRGEDFSVNIRVDTQGECINAVEINVAFSNAILQAIDFNDANSILNLWIKKPEINQIDGKIIFAGGIPNGYCGQISGDPGKSNLIGAIMFRSATDNINSNNGQISFLPDSRVLLNDGMGTLANLTTKNLDFQINEKRIEIPSFRWYEILKKDNIPPEKFQPEISKNSLVFDNKYFLVFSTTDKQTGIDYYEICEIPQTISLKGALCNKADSPYLLKDQSLRSIIEVRAVDKAGNKQIIKIPASTKTSARNKLSWLIFILMSILGFVIWKYTHSTKNEF